MLKKDIILEEKYKGVKPLCKCGCGIIMEYNPTQGDFPKYVRGHNSREKGHWGDWNNEKRVQNISKTRKEKFASGEYNHHLDQLKQPRSKETIEKIKITKKENPYHHTEEAKKSISEFRKKFKYSKESKEKMSDSAIENIIKTGKVKRSKLEYKFEGILIGMNIGFNSSYYIKSIKKIYDFYLPSYNILIEIDGNFWHCNPKFHSNPICKTQEINIENDKLKNEWAEQNGYKLLRFWEDDINNNPQLVMEILKKELNLI